MPLKLELTDFLNNNLLLCRSVPDAKPLEIALEQMLQRLNEPLRVAVVGSTSVGKSTLMNALLGNSVVCTGALETTYNVCRFRYGERPSITVQFQDGTEKTVPFSDLEKWSVRASNAHNPELQRVRELVIYYPSEILKKIEFVDTPGLNSIYGKDVRNTEEFLAVRGSEDTVYQASQADAVLYAIKDTMSVRDVEILHSYQKPGSASSPINSIGVLTRVDINNWKVKHNCSPVEQNRPIANNLIKKPGIQKILFSIYPVCAKPVEGITQMQPQDWDYLDQLVDVNEDNLMELLEDASLFCTLDDPEFTEGMGSAIQRKQLFDKLGAYGILETVRQRRKGTPREEVRQILCQECGIEEVSDILRSHFGNRTVLIKTQYIFNHLRSVAQKLQAQAAAEADLWYVCKNLQNKIDEIHNSMLVLQELRLLQRYYNGQVSFNEEESQELLRLTGENGWNLETRLNATPGSSVEELANLTHKKLLEWRTRANDWMREPSYCQAAEQMVHIYEYLHYHLTALCEA